MLIVFHFEISGKEIKNVHPSNKQPISLTFSIFHFEISGKYFNLFIFNHSYYIQYFLYILLKFRIYNEEHPPNKLFIL